MKDKWKAGLRYSEDFKKNAIETLLTSNMNMNQLSEQLGVSFSSLREWKTKYLRRSGSIKRDGQNLSAAELERELQALRQENEHLRRQREILKKALGILSDAPQPNGMP